MPSTTAEKIKLRFGAATWGGWCGGPVIVAVIASSLID
jgi:hypothetical protein